MAYYAAASVYKCTAAEVCSIYLDGSSFYPFSTDDDGHSLRNIYSSIKFDSAGSVYTNNNTTIIIVVVTILMLLLLFLIYDYDDSSYNFYYLLYYRQASCTYLLI